MKRIYYISSQHMKVFEWHGDAFLGALNFQTSDIETETLHQYLSQSADCLSYIIVDVIDEEFRTETIPLVNSRERSTLINRLKDRHYRDIEHIQIQTSQILKGDRKEEELLICALSNYETIQSWTNLLIEHEIPIAGIWSAALLQSSILRLIDIKADNILLVSRELPFTQRETFFLNGKVRFSRLEKLDSDYSKDHEPKSSLIALQHGTEQIRHYLTNHRVIRFNETITVVCVVPSQRVEEYNTLKGEFNSNELKYTFLSDSKIRTTAGYTVCSEDSQDIALSWACKKQLPLRDNYTTTPERLPFFKYTVEKGLRAGTITMALALVFCAALFWIDSINYERSTRSLTQQKNNLVDYYNATYGNRGYLIDSAEAITYTVEKYEKINKEAANTPQGFFNELSSVYSQPLFRTVQLNQLTWSKLSPQEYQETLAALTPNNTNLDDEFYDDSSEQDDSDDAMHLVSTIRLRGNVDTEGLSYRTINSIMNEFYFQLEKLPSVEITHVVRIPFDIRPTSKFRDQTGKYKEGIAKEEDANKYEILLTMKKEPS